MGNPYEYREVMCAAFQFGTTKTVEEVVADQEARHEAADRERKAKDSAKAHQARLTPGAVAARSAPRAGQPAASEIAKVRELLAAGQGRKPPDPAPGE